MGGPPAPRVNTLFELSFKMAAMLCNLFVHFLQLPWRRDRILALLTIFTRSIFPTTRPGMAKMAYFLALASPTHQTSFSSILSTRNFQPCLLWAHVDQLSAIFKSSLVNFLKSCRSISHPTICVIASVCFILFYSVLCDGVTPITSVCIRHCRSVCGGRSGNNIWICEKSRLETSTSWL